MIQALGRLAFALAAPLILSSCFLTPGKFTSALTIDADRSFTYSYQGEVILQDIGEDFAKGMSSGDTISDGKGDLDASPEDEGQIGNETEARFTRTAWQDSDSDSASDGGMSDDTAATAAQKAAEKDRKLRAVADALRKEAGYRKVDYVGEGKFIVDYRISGTLTHNFLYPFNIDAGTIIPFIAIELRTNGTVRVKAPGFGNESTGSEAMSGASDSRKAVDGTFTLDTNAEIVSQNNEDGATTAGGRKTISWKVTPLTKDAPTAVLKMAR